MGGESRLRTMEIDAERMEYRVCIKDSEAQRAWQRTFFFYNGANMTLSECNIWAVKKAQVFGVEEIIVFTAGVGYLAYDQISEIVRGADGFATVKAYRDSRLD